jgi:ParB family chromosome partitioning protein
MAVRKSGLGGGLEALIPTEASGGGTGYANIAVEQIKANPDQPRARFDDASLAELATSIDELGVLQPIVVEEREDGYTLIAGERRWRAAKRAGLSLIPAVIREKSGDHTLVEALVENVQRMDLTPLEEARAYRQLLEEYGMTQDAIASRVGKSRPSISNTLRLLQLPAEIQAYVEDGELSSGHARSLVGMEDEKYALHLAGKAVSEGWSVRQIEDAVKLRRGLETGPGSGTASVKTLRPVEIIELEKRLGDRLGAKVKIDYRSQKGRVEIKFGSIEELERLYRVMTAG